MNLVTGAAGHIGNVLVRALLAKGEKVRALVLPEEDLTSLEGLDVEFFTGNILDSKRMEEACRGIKRVYHLAGLVAIVPGKSTLMQEVNVQGTQSMLEAAQKAGVERFIYTSSIHAIRKVPMGEVIDESCGFDIHSPDGDYNRTKAQASLMVLEANKPGFETIVVCPTGVIGPWDFRRSEIGEMILTWMKKKPLVLSLEGQYDFVDVRDVAEGHWLAAERGTPGECYLLGGEQISISAIINLVQDAAGFRSPQLKFPAWIALMVAPLAEFFYRITRTRPRVTRYSVLTLQENSVISSQKAKQELGWSARKMAECIQDTVSWWQKNLDLTHATLREDLLKDR